MDFVEPTEEEINALLDIHDRKYARLHLITNQLEKYQVCVVYSEIDIVITNGDVLFINCLEAELISVLLKDGQYYLQADDNITPINPIAQYEPIDYQHVDYFFTIADNLGNAIYVNDHIENKRLHLLIYFNETCKPNPDGEGFILGDRIIKPFCDVHGNITVFDNLGNIVPYHTIECPGKKYECEIDNDRFHLHIYSYEYDTKERDEEYDGDYEYVADYTAKGQHTKAAPRLAELSAE